MKRDDNETICVLYIEAGDEKQALLKTLRMELAKDIAVVIILPDVPCKAFQSPKDFHDIKMFKRQGRLAIFFVITSGNLAQWARMNGFIVYASLDSLMRSIKVKQPHQSPPHVTDISQASYEPSASLSSVQLHEPDSYPLSLETPLTPLLFHDEYPPITSPPVADFKQADYGTEPKDRAFLPRQSSRPLPANRLQATPEQKTNRKRQGLVLVLAIVLLCSILSATLLFSQKTSTPSQTASPKMLVGHVYFLSSGQLEQMGKNGVNDSIKIALSHLPPPAPGKSYYAWLRSDADRSDGPVFLLGKLTVSPQGEANLTYVDPQHTDLLAGMSRFLVTEEALAVPPTFPSPDQSTWRYQGMIAQIPDPHDQNRFSQLDHLRHLLTAEPTLEKIGMHGGLTLWLYRNTSKLLEWTRNAQDDWGHKDETALMRRQVIRTLDYLDGISNVASGVPVHTPVLVDSRQGSVGLLQIHANQQPSALTQQIGYHLLGLLDAPGISTSQYQNATQIDTALKNVHLWLENARQDAKHLLMLSDDQLQSQEALALLNDLMTQVNAAYVGITDPATNAEQHGVVWIYNVMHSLATVDVQTWHIQGI